MSFRHMVEARRTQYDRDLAPSKLMQEHGMDNYTAIALAEGFEDGDEDQVIDAWQHLVNTGLAWQLQGWFGRTAATLIEQGVIQAAGEVTHA